MILNTAFLSETIISILNVKSEYIEKVTEAYN